MENYYLAEGLKNAGPVITALVLFLRVLRQYQPVGKNKKREHESLEFISSFLAFDLSKRNRLVVEHAFEAYLSKRLSYEEIILLMQLNNPLASIKLFIKSRQHVTFNPETKGFEYKKPYSTVWKRNIYKAIYTLFYFIFSMLGLFLLFYFPDIIGSTRPVMYFPLGLLVFIFLLIAYYFLEDMASIFAADQLLVEIKYSRIVI